EYDQEQAVFDAMRNLFPFFQPATGTHIIASSSAHQVSFAAGGKKQAGLTAFGYTLANFFKPEPTNIFTFDEIDRKAKSTYWSSKLTVSDLANYTRRKVARMTDGAQLPEYRQSNFRSDFLIWSDNFD
ncbi:MAG TPA: hypothetical protein DCF33_08515, partial [Saprospirales bacterium]|nr:hypothetical protein [Saprospirales bacterium]